MPKSPGLPKGYITLKEAARISGYAPDYVGQLIRKGRLSGRQVYYNTAWITTEAAIQEYLAADESGAKRGSEPIPEGFGEKVQQVKNRLFSEVRLLAVAQLFLYVGLGFAVIFAVFLFYVLSVNVDHVLDKRATERALQAVEKGLAPSQP